MSEYLIDSGIITKYEFTAPENFLRAWMAVSIADHPLEYQAWEGGERTETITVADLFNSDSLNTAWGKPILLEHPEDAITKDNYSLLKPRGTTMSDFVQDDKVLTILGVIHDAEAIQAVLDGKNFVSAGYLRELETVGGKLWQKKRNYNHFALCDNPRASDRCKLHMIADSRASIEQQKEKVTFQKAEIPPMTTKKFQLVNDSYDIPEAVYNHITALGNDIQGLANDKIALVADQTATKSQLQSLTDAKIKLEGQVQGLQLQLDSVPKEDAIAAEAQERSETWAIVLPAFIADAKKTETEFKPDYSLKAVAVKKLFLKTFHPGQYAEWNLDSQPDLFINGVWLGLAPKPEALTEASDQVVKDTTNQLLRQITDATTTAVNTTSPRDRYTQTIEAAHTKSA